MKTKLITQSAIIAALYTVLTFVSAAVGMSSGVIQLRLSEALTVLPYFTPAAIPGLFLGCLISNTLTGCMVWDIVFGSLATLIGAIITYLLRKNSKWLAPVGPIVANTLIVPIILVKIYEVEQAFSFIVFTVAIGEIISCYLFGMILLNYLKKYQNKLF